MDLDVARHLSELNTRFYQQARTSFAATRQSGWPGWGRLLELVGWSEPAGHTVLDLACGNLRFERYLRERGQDVQAWAYDNCDELALASDVVGVSYRHLDVMDVLYGERDLARAIDAPACDLSVSFGFLHHVPLMVHRVAVCQALLEHARPGGVVAVSLWQFARDERLLSKAEPVVGGDPGDYLLGWQGTDLRRYCHSFSEDEVEGLADALSCEADLLDSYSADGKTGNLNRYLVLQRR